MPPPSTAALRGLGIVPRCLPPLSPNPLSQRSSAPSIRILCPIRASYLPPLKPSPSLRSRSWSLNGSPVLRSYARSIICGTRRYERRPVGPEDWYMILILFIACVLLEVAKRLIEDGFFNAETRQRQRSTIHKIQVGVLGIARTLQKDLNGIAETANTSTSQGPQYMLTGTSLTLLRHFDCCISAYSHVYTKESVKETMKRINQLSIEERERSDDETLRKVNNSKKHRKNSQSTDGFNNEYIVVTILVRIEGEHKLPAINDRADLKDALEKLSSLPSKRIEALEVLWTPEKEEDILTDHQLLEDYPLLRSL